MTSPPTTSRVRRKLGDLTVRRRRCVDPICGAEFARFKDGLRDRPNALCPRCESAERHRVLWLYLKDSLGDQALKVLHVAPERGIERKLRELPNVDYVSTDLSPESAMVAADLTDLPFEGDSFDLVICNHVLEHIPDDVAAMSELKRVLRPGGRAVMQHPIDLERDETFEDPAITAPADREEIYGQFDHVRIYGLDFADRLRRAGFEDIERIKYTDRFSPDQIMRMGLLPHASNAPHLDVEADRIYVAR